MLLFMCVIDVIFDCMICVKYKVIDFVNYIGEGEMGFVVYVGDVFVISFLMKDV